MIRGDEYQFKYTSEETPEVLIYHGNNWSGNGYWHQFVKKGENKVWCELQDGDLHLIEEVV